MIPMARRANALSDSIRGFIERGGNNNAIIVQDGTRPWSYMRAVLAELEDALANVEQREGLSVGIITRNQPPHLALIAATIALRHRYVTLNPMFSDQELANDIEQLGLHAIAAISEDFERPGVMEAAVRSRAAVIELRSGGTLALIHERKVGLDSRERTDVAISMLSSGTTGVPKRILLSYDNLSSAVGQLVKAKPGVESGRPTQLRPALIWHPVGHISGAVMAIESFSVGRPVILMERFEPLLWTALVERYEVRLGQLNQAGMRMILDGNIEPSQLRSLLYIRGGTAATPPELQEEFERRFNIPVMTTYGATEFAGAVASWSTEDYQLHGKTHVGSSGRPHPGVKMRTIDPDDGHELAIGEEGILEVLAPQAANGNGNWVRTTDLAVIDSEGFLWIKGRADDVINRGGFKVHPSKVERAFKEHPAVQDVAVVGLDDPRLGSVPVAAIVLREDAVQPTVEQLLHFVDNHLARYEIPTRVVIVEALPLTLSMKVSRPALRELFTE
jgi:acyl-CoA synthetase (AMP-forming)/AMP-acid ligase II